MHTKRRAAQKSLSTHYCQEVHTELCDNRCVISSSAEMASSEWLLVNDKNLVIKVISTIYYTISNLCC